MHGLFDAVLGQAAADDPHAPALLRRARHFDASFTIDTAEEIGVVLTLTERHRVERRMGNRRSAERPRFGSVTILPPGCPAHFTITGPASVLMLRLPWPEAGRWMEEENGADPDRIDLQPRLHADDPTLARLLFDAASRQAEPDVGLRARAIAIRLLGAHSARPVSPFAAPLRAGFSPARLRRVLDRIEEGLSGPLPITALARDVGMSPFHFAREFQQATGTSPHQHVLRRRVARAVMLLARRDLTIAEVAQAAGFAHASHLSRHLRRAAGLSPEAFRSRVLP